MEFDMSKVYTALDADEIKIGSKVIVASNLSDLKSRVTAYYERNVNGYSAVIAAIEAETNAYRFVINNDTNAYASNHFLLAYLLTEPDTLKCKDLEIGDIISDGEFDLMILGIDRKDKLSVYTPLGWLDDEWVAKFYKKNLKDKIIEEAKDGN